MIRQIWFDFVTSYREYEGTGTVLVLFAVSLCFLMIVNLRQNKEKKNPALFFGFAATIGCAFSEFFYTVFDKNYEKKSQKRWACIFALILIVFATAVSGKRIFSRNHIEKADNQFHLSRCVVEVCDKLLEVQPSGEIRIFSAPGTGDEFTAYSSRFVCAYKEYYGDLTKYDETTRNAYVELSDVHPDMEKVEKAARMTESRYVILKSGIWPDIPLEDYGYTCIFQNDEMSVYEDSGEVSAP